MSIEKMPIKVNDLIDMLSVNRDNHRTAFEKALNGWKAAVTEKLRDMYDEALAGKKYGASFHMPAPEDHTEDYDRVIQFLEMTTLEEIEVDSTEFASYVRDDWGWKDQWTSSNVGYMGR